LNIIIPDVYLMEPPDSELVVACRNGNLRKFRILVERYKKPAYFYALGMTGNADDALDISQEAFINAYKSLNRFDGSHQFKSWLFSILANLCKNALRSADVRRKYFSSDGVIRAGSISEAGGPEENLIAKEKKEAVWKALSAIDEEAREIIVLKHFQDMSYKEIAEVLSIPVGSVMSRLHYARLKLKNALHLSPLGLGEDFK
jgi:RNA polymerase sigma-70 factor (ECF subfamily)